MPKAECYYKILGIEETAGSDEIKKAYRNLALVWHPDKNQSNPEAAHAKFQTILKAYETLSDSREREWYDRHKDQILSDGDPKDAESQLNLFQYFSSSCYANFDDSEDGFYTVYRKVFEQLAEEEQKALEQVSRYSKNKSKANSKEDPRTFPSFGDSNSDYEQIVRPFYSFWSGFCTSLTFDHLDKYNTTEAENRRILRAMEKENKKVKDAAKKERNANVRNLVEFIKKRDRRLKAHKLLVEERNQLNRQKTAEKQKQQRVKCHQDLESYRQANWHNFDDMEEQLQQLENDYQDFVKTRKGRKRRVVEQEEEDDNDNEEEEEDENSEVEAGIHHSEDEVENNSQVDDVNDDSRPKEGDVGKESAGESDNDDSEEDEESFRCVACNKEFRSVNAFQNHEASKKHKLKVLKLTNLLRADETKLNK